VAVDVSRAIFGYTVWQIFLHHRKVLKAVLVFLVGNDYTRDMKQKQLFYERGLPEGTGLLSGYSILGIINSLNNILRIRSLGSTCHFMAKSPVMNINMEPKG
jgi:hypothetical protein